MNAPKMSHTVALAKPESSHARAALNALKPGFASSAGAKNTYGESTATTVTPISPIAPPGSGSSISATMTPAKIAKKYHACGASPAGGGTSAINSVTAIGTIARHATCGGLIAFAMPTAGPAAGTGNRS